MLHIRVLREPFFVEQGRCSGRVVIIFLGTALSKVPHWTLRRQEDLVLEMECGPDCCECMTPGLAAGPQLLRTPRMVHACCHILGALRDSMVSRRPASFLRVSGGAHHYYSLDHTLPISFLLTFWRPITAGQPHSLPVTLAVARRVRDITIWRHFDA